MILLIFIFGLIFGSFINALVWRLHKQEAAKSKKAKSKYSLTKGRSQCVNCHHQLGAADLVPVLSWVALAGKCRYCKKPISAQYPTVELFTAFLFGLSYWFWPYSFNLLGFIAFFVWLYCLILLIILFVYDLKWFILPNILVLNLTIGAVILTVLIAIIKLDFYFILQAFLASLILFGIFYIIFQVSGGKWIGGGDVKIAVSLGLFAATPAKAFLLIFLSSVIGTLLAIPLLLGNKLNLKSYVPFGPLLIIATVLIVLFGNQMISWYLQTFLYI